MRWLTLSLIALIALLQYPLWIGKGGWLRVWDVGHQLEQQREANQKLQIRNSGLDAEVRDLKQGFEAIEERARFELGMIKQSEVFVQIPDRMQAANEHPAETDSSSAAPSSAPMPPAAARAR
ncbi:cell division protein FtsB [Rhodocyclus tenuis]|uniref:Cell division protein FtsB n=2 Tax=Rhodocyclus TaxID=1064 RepID=A0A6L5JVV8_RHOTE|nr:cell division protein FtsB [Rhodocyclus gracilis]MQY50932.1 cell division protein FtsB [Rhodocyclus gracilis]MRD72906.1 cell division protein FtsB [Rhodocyclus gracilis]NJA88643.1 cell division protein FtsB [Rhodocyclus gracilis]